MLPCPIMRKALVAATAALAVLAIQPARLDAWGFTGHKFITDRAIDLLPPEIRPFFQKFRTTVVEHSIDPDTYRTIGFVEEPPRHFLDMDAYGPFPFKELPHDYDCTVVDHHALGNDRAAAETFLRAFRPSILLANKPHDLSAAAFRMSAASAS